MSSRPKPVVLIVLDGWGLRHQREHNAIAGARTPVWDRLWRELPHASIRTSGSSVGLPSGQMGNSEVGHLNIGAGRVVYQEFTRVSRSIRTGSFFSNRTLTDAVDMAVGCNTAVHILGLLSPGGVHSHEEHIHAMARLAVERGAPRVYLHAFLDGRDMPPKSAGPSITAMDAVFAALGRGRIASISGRYFAMDRDNRWDRVERAYDLLVDGAAEFEAPDASTALALAYERDETDEFVQPTRIVPPGEQQARIQDGDVVVNMNYRSDRVRQITRALVDPGFAAFRRKTVRRLAVYVSLTEYSKDFTVPIAFPPERLKNGFGEYIASLGLHQLRLAETEKYAHVTFFFNGGAEQPFEGEERLLIPSPNVPTYDLKPEMSAREVTDALVDAILGGRFDAIVCNYANADMVGHTGKYDAAVKAVETIDQCLGRVVEAIRRVGGEMLVTADHGNAEQMVDEEAGQPHTAHTNNLVPLIYVGHRKATLRADGALCDLAPTLLRMMGLAQPQEMTGRPLINLAGAASAA